MPYNDTTWYLSIFHEIPVTWGGSNSQLKMHKASEKPTPPPIRLCSKVVHKDRKDVWLGARELYKRRTIKQDEGYCQVTRMTFELTTTSHQLKDNEPPQI
ncbi:hypothetical protein TNCV_3083841 [Trichonephila clavipes]|nr:hypothetical protein TNCV_3083841 [Trichonephila clavipes]